MGYLRENSLNREVNQNSGEVTELGVTKSILMEVEAVRGCALNRRCLSKEKCRKSSNKVRQDRPLGWSALEGGRTERESGGRREGMIDEGGGELRPCRVTQA